MKKLLWIIIILSIFTSANIAQAQSALPATSVRTSDGSNVQLKLNALSSSAASNTAEIEAINQNLATHEAELAAITAEINLMSVNLGTIEVRLDSIESNILSMIEPAITELRLNLGTIEDLINSNYNSLFANLGTHENELNDIKSNLATHETSLLALQTNDGTQETRIESNEVALLADIVNLATNYWTAATTKLYVDTTDETTITALNTQISRYNQTGSSGALDQPVIADDGSGGVIISPFSYVLKTSNSDTGELSYFMSDTVEIASADLTDNSMNWIYVDYNSGTPTFNDTTSYSNIRNTDQFLVGFLFKSGTSLSIVSHGTEISNFVAREEARLYARGIVERMSGAVIGEKATRYVTMTEGLFYSGISRVVRAARDSETDGFSGYWSYNSGTTTWTNNAATYPNQIENTLYNNTATGVLAELTVNRYGVHWIYLCGNGNLHVVFGQGNYTLANAQAAQPPSVLPACLTDMGALLGRIIIQKSAATFTEVDSAFNIMFSPSGVTNHNDLANRTDAGSHPATAISYTDTYSIGATELQAAIDTVTVWLNSVDLRLESLETNIISLIQPAIDIITANLDTHETAITALITNDQTQEVRLVRATASYENRYKKMILNYGYPIAINGLWDVNKAAAVYAMYDIVVLGEYEKTTHEAHADTVSIIERLKELKTDVEVFGYVAIGGELGANLDTAEIQLRIDEWLATGATGIFLDEFGYDYLVTRERQNMAVDYAHSKGMNVIANSWNIDWVFNNDDGYIEWEEFYGNPNLVAPSINSDDYYLFENLFYYYEGGQKASDQWRIYEVYRYYYDSATSTWGKNYYDQFGTKTLGLDGIQSTNANKDLYFINAYVGGRIINLDGYGASIELWGSSSTAYNHYNPSFFNNEASMFHRDKIQPTVSDYLGTTYAQYDTKINGVTVKLIWKPGATASNPTLGTHKVQINGVDRTKTYVSSSATNANTASTLVARDASGNFSAGTITAALAGNASTATKLAIPKNIAGTAFDGSLDIDISHNNLINIGLRSHDDIDAAFSTIEIELSSISVAINNLDLRLGAIELILAGGSSGEVLTKTDDSFTWATIPAGVTDHTLLSNIGTKTHLELEQDILDLQANPAGISRVYIDGVALPTGEVEFVSGDNITLNVSGSTVEVMATGGGGALKSEMATEVGDGYNFDITYVAITDECQVFDNGLLQWPTNDYYLDTVSGHTRIRFNSAVDAGAKITISSVR